MSQRSSSENLSDKVTETGQTNFTSLTAEEYQVGKISLLNNRPKDELLKLGLPDLALEWGLGDASFKTNKTLGKIGETFKTDDSTRISKDAKAAEPVSSLGKFLLSRQEAVASQRDTIGYCWPAVADVYDLSHPKTKASGFSAKDASATFERDHRFKEQSNTSDAKVDTDALTPGCIVILTPSKRGIDMGHPHGHIFVYMGKGEIVDGPDHRPHFVPQEKMKDPAKALPVEASDHFEYIHAKQIYNYSKTRLFKPVSEQV